MRRVADFFVNGFRITSHASADVLNDIPNHLARGCNTSAQVGMFAVALPIFGGYALLEAANPNLARSLRRRLGINTSDDIEEFDNPLPELPIARAAYYNIADPEFQTRAELAQQVADAAYKQAAEEYSDLEFDEEFPDDLLCPISCLPMRNPMTIITQLNGEEVYHVIDQSTLDKLTADNFSKNKPNLNPFNRQEIIDSKPNLDVKEKVDAFISSHTKVKDDKEEENVSSIRLG